MKAKRFNKDKIDMSLLPVEACLQEAKVWQLGEKKYGRDNWKKLWGDDTIQVAMASLLRHAFAILDGQINDPETGLDHAAHIRCNAAMILEYRKVQTTTEPEEDIIEIEIPIRQKVNGGDIVIYHTEHIKRSELDSWREKYEIVRIIDNNKDYI